MSSEWDDITGEDGKKVETSRFRRALRIGGLATRMSGSFLKRQLAKIGQDTEDLEHVTGAAIDNAKHIVSAMGEMKGAVMKLGQMISTDPEMIDAGFAEQLSVLQSSAPPMDYMTLATQFEVVSGQPIDTVFRFFEPTPVGAASIGQVHRAELFDGRTVAVKIQYPGVRDSIDSDLKNVRGLLKLGRAFTSQERLDALMKEARDSIVRESDYTIEANNLQRFRSHFAEWEHIRIPEPIMEWSRPGLLVMEYIDGVPFDEGVNALESEADRARLARQFVEVFVHMFHELNELHSDPHPGNFLLDSDGKIVLLDFGCVREFDPEYSDNVLRIIRSYWNGDMTRALQLHRTMGFGTPDVTYPTEEEMRAYFDLILEPMARNEPFRFADFEIQGKVRGFLKDHLHFLKLVPPPELLLYFRVVGGLKGMLTRMNAGVDLRAVAESCCERRGI